MNVIATKLEGCYIIEPTVIPDKRGYFMESYNEQALQQAISQPVHFVQDNQSYSSKGVLRGLHYQTGAHAQAKLVRVIHGEVLDVVVDIRPDSATFGQHVSVVLSGENQRQFFIPRGFAHGFLVTSDNAIFFYKCDNYYNRESEGGIYFNDPELEIEWKFPLSELNVSEKDQQLPRLQNARKAW